MDGGSISPRVSALMANDVTELCLDASTVFTYIQGYAGATGTLKSRMADGYRELAKRLRPVLKWADCHHADA
jgi:hypothetical protein